MRLFHPAWLSSLSLALVFLVVAGDAATKQDVLNYFQNISGRNVISGHHNREPNSDPTLWTRKVHEITGKYPGLWGGDFLFAQDDVNQRQTMIDEAIRQWNQGSFVCLSFHSCPPQTGEVCNWEGNNGIQSTLSDDQWSTLTQDGGDLNTKWKRRLDVILPFFQQLKDAGVVPIFRPFHEINGNWFWWTDRPGPQGSAKLFQLTRDYFEEHGMDNVVWTWGAADQGRMDAIQEYWPGTDYVDVASLDVYDPNNKQPSYDTYQRILQVSQGKPIALAEVGQIPNPTTLSRQNRWIWFMVWADFVVDPRWNTNQRVRATYNDRRVLSQGQINGFRRNM